MSICYKQAPNMCSQGPRNIDNWGGALIHILVFTDCKNNRFQKEINDAQHEYMNMSPPTYRSSAAPVFSVASATI